MANPKHLDILKSGKDEWDNWRANTYDLVEQYAHEDDFWEIVLKLGQDNPDLAPDLSGADLRDLHLAGIDFAAVNLREANLARAVLHNAHCEWSDLQGANLHGAKLFATTFSHSNMENVDLGGASLGRALLNGVNLKGANLLGANFSEADLSGANLSDAHLGSTIFGLTTLRNVSGLESCEHHRPSVLDHRTVHASGMLPILFLRGCGLPDDYIEYLPSLINEPIQLFSCFISFTESDDVFAQRLYNDLQGKGIRCWRWKEDAKWGRSLMSEIDRAIRIADKLIVVCSENSLRSMPVIREIERALQREDELFKQGQEAEVLFPIRLDDYIFHSWLHPRKPDVLSKNVGDFRNWKGHDDYSASLMRLVKSLKIEV